jgi:hypothetical protein
LNFLHQVQEKKTWSPITIDCILCRIYGGLNEIKIE